MKFKIDLYSSSFPFALFVWKPNPISFFGFREWVLVDTFKTRDDAKAFHTAVKDLPEYLD